MVVHELIELLKKQDPASEVGFAYPSGDYWKTVVVGEPNDVVEEYVIWSDYHSMERMASEQDVADRSLRTRTFVILQP